MQVLVVIVGFGFGCLLSLGMNWIALARFRPAEAAHWTERARRLYPLRRSAALNIWLIPMLCDLVLLVAFPNEVGFLLALLAGLSAWVGAIVGTYPFDKKVFPQFSFKLWLRWVYGAWVLHFGGVGVMIVGGVVVPSEFGWATVVIGCVVVVSRVALHYGLWLRLARISGLLVPVTDAERLAGIVRGTAEKMQVRYRAIWRLRTPLGYAAALPTTGDLIFSDGMIELQPDEEIAAVCAHELAHLSEPRSTVLARVVGSLSWCPLIFIRPMVHAFDFVGIALLLIPMALLAVYERRLSRRMEVRADAVADKNTAEAGVYARALERLYQMNQMPAVMPGSRQVHPHLYDRLLAAGVTPEYPRPKAPASLFWTSGLMYLILVILLVVFLGRQNMTAYF
jgi:Zn-dependent protease with chaperone function